MTEPIEPIAASRRKIREGRSWLVPLGILLVVLGGLAIVAAFAATLATVLFFGVLLLIGGVAQLAHAVSSRSADFAWELGGGLVYLLAGGLLVLDPVSGAVGLTLLIAFFFLFVGIVRLSLGLRVRRAGASGAGHLVTGVLDLLLGGLIVLGWPESAAWVIGLFLGIELLFGGISLLLVTRGASAGPRPS